MQADSWQKEGDVTAAGVMLEGCRNIGAEPDPEKECILVARSIVTFFLRSYGHCSLERNFQLRK